MAVKDRNTRCFASHLFFTYSCWLVFFTLTLVTFWSAASVAFRLRPFPPAEVGREEDEEEPADSAADRALAAASMPSFFDIVVNSNLHKGQVVSCLLQFDMQVKQNTCKHLGSVPVYGALFSSSIQITHSSAPEAGAASIMN